MKTNKYEPKKTAKKAGGALVLVSITDIIVQILLTAQFDVLDMSVRALAISGIVALQNYLKHRK